MAFPFLAAAGLVMGGIQTAVSASKASKLPDPQKYTVSPEMRLAYNMARTRADEGYSAEERSAFEQMLARQGTATKQMFRNMGMAGAGSAAANIMGTDALNQFAAQGANIRRQNFGQFASMAQGIQGVQDQETGRFNEQLRAEETALGGATQAGIGNMFGALNQGMNFMQNEQAIGAYQGINAGGGNFFGNQQQTGFNSGGTQGQNAYTGLSQLPQQGMQQPQQPAFGGFGNPFQPPVQQQSYYGFSGVPQGQGLGFNFFNPQHQYSHYDGQ